MTVSDGSGALLASTASTAIFSAPGIFVPGDVPVTLWDKVTDREVIAAAGTFITATPVEAALFAVWAARPLRRREGPTSRRAEAAYRSEQGRGGDGDGREKLRNGT